MMYPLSVVFKPQQLPYSSSFRNCEMTIGPWVRQHMLPIPIGVSLIQVDWRCVEGNFKMKITRGDAIEWLRPETRGQDLPPRVENFRVVTDVAANLSIESANQSTISINGSRIGVTVIPMNGEEILS